MEEAKRFNLNDTISFEDEDSDSGNEDEADNENYKKKKSKSKVNKNKVNNREKLFSYYPLTCKIKLNINCKHIIELIMIEYRKLNIDLFESKHMDAWYLSLFI